MPRVRLPVRLTVTLAEDDRALLDRFAGEQDESAFAALVGRHARMVYGVCRRAVRDEHLAEDAFQAVFLVLAKHPGKAAGAASVGGWLFGVARRVGMAARRHEQRRGRRVVVASPVPESHDFDELLRVLDEELAGLPEAYRAPLVACFLEERTQDEAARELGWSLSTLRRRLDRAKELLRARLTRRGATLAGGLFAGILAPSALAAVPKRLLEAVARPSPLAAELASQAVGGSLFVKVWLPFVAVAVALGGLAAGLAGEQPRQPPASPPVAAEVAPGPRPATRTAWVTVTGRVVFPEERDVPKPRFVPAGMIKDADHFLPAGVMTYGDVVIDAKTRGLANAVVWLRPDSDDPKATFPADKVRPAEKQYDRLVEAGPNGFAPRVVAARTGDRIVYANPTPIAFNVMYQRNNPVVPPMAGEADGFNVIVVGGKTHTTGPLTAVRMCDTVKDNIHPWVQGYVWTFDHPYFAVTDAAGNFSLPEVPAGAWRMVVWHEKVGYRNAAKGRLGERVVVAGNGKMELGNVVHASPGWDEKPDPE